MRMGGDTEAVRSVLRESTAYLVSEFGGDVVVAEAQEAQELRDAHRLIRESHYQKADAYGQVVIAKLSDAAWERVARKFKSKAYSRLIGAAIVGRGCTRGKPVGRLHLAEKHFPRLDLSSLPRDVTVERMRLAMIHRVAVVPEFRDYGIGTRLAYECRKVARVENRPARFVEVITTRKRGEAIASIQGEAEREDFLQNAGFVLAPQWSGRERRRLGPQPTKFEDTVRLYYWASTIKTDGTAT
jgi:hypothetical protein